MKKTFITFLFIIFSHPAMALEIGSWYDDVGSPEYLDSTLIIQEENGRYVLIRVNGDGSGGKHQLEKNGNSYLKVGDKFGVKYVATKNGLEIYDRKGYIRTAIPK